MKLAGVPQCIVAGFTFYNRPNNWDNGSMMLLRFLAVFDMGLDLVSSSKARHNGADRTRS